MDATTAQALQTYASIVLTILTAGTLGVLIWYTIETARLRKAADKQTRETGNLLKEARKQNETAVMPIMAVHVASDEVGGRRRIVMGNVGFGPAFNLSMEPHQWGNKTLHVIWRQHIMKVGDEAEIEFLYEEGSTITKLDVDSLYEWINTKRLPEPLVLTVRCQSVNSMGFIFAFGCVPVGGRLVITFDGTK